MSAYTETNFNRCLDVVSDFKNQRNRALRIADRLSKLMETEFHGYSKECSCGLCVARLELEILKEDVRQYQNAAQKK